MSNTLSPSQALVQQPVTNSLIADNQLPGAEQASSFCRSNRRRQESRRLVSVRVPEYSSAAQEFYFGIAAAAVGSQHVLNVLPCTTLCAYRVNFFSTAAKVVKVPAIPTQAEASSEMAPVFRKAANSLSMALVKSANSSAPTGSERRNRSVKRTDPRLMLSGMCDTGIIAADKFRTAAADIDYQKLFPDQRKSSLHCQKRIGRFIIAGDHTDVESQLQRASVAALRNYCGRREERWCRPLSLSSTPNVWHASK